MRRAAQPSWVSRRILPLATAARSFPAFVPLFPETFPHRKRLHCLTTNGATPAALRSFLMETSTPRSRASLHRRAFAVSALVCAGALACLVGCAGPRPPRQGPPEQPQSPLAARTVFFTGTIVAEAKVTSFRHSLQRPGHEDDSSSGANDRRHSGPPPGGGGMGAGGPPGGGGGGGHGSMGAGGPPPDGGGRDHGDSVSAPRRRGGSGALPRQTLRISFTNRTEAPFTIAITELNSLIGNFAPRPEKLTIAPGATESLEPVSGDAGGLLNWLDVTLSLRHGGTAESHVLHLIPTGEPAESATPPPAKR